VDKNKGFWILAIYLFLAIYLLPMFPHGGSADELTRWATAASLVEKSSFDISWTQDLIDPNVNTTRVGNAVYSNDPPGIALLGAPIYALTRAVAGPPNQSNIRTSWFAMRFFFSSLPLLLLGFWLYGRDADELSLGVLLFASPIFVYSLLFFSHVFVGVLLYTAFRIIFDARRIFLRNCFLAGIICGFSAISEFTAIIPVAVMGIGLLFTERADRFRNVFFFAAGGVPFLAILFAYNWSIFGSPFALQGYASLPELSEIAGQGVYAIGPPSISNFYLILFSPSRGLFFYAPILILSVVAFITSRESKTLRHRLKVAIVVASFVAVTVHGAIHGGWSFGPRYLVMILPLLLDSFFDGEIYEFSNLWQGFLFAISFVLCTFPILTFPFAPPEFKYPHNSFWGKFIWSENWFTPNLGNSLGLPAGIWGILPAAVSLLAVVYIVWRYARRPARFFIGSVAGVTIVSAYLLLPNLDSAENRFRRATIAERYFKPAGRLAAFESSIAAERIRDFEWTIADTRGFAPDDFPYLEDRAPIPSPSAEIRRALDLNSSGKSVEAESLLVAGKERYPFARCELSTHLAAIFYETGRTEAALRELEGIQELVNANSRADCLRSQFMLGSLYRELGNSDRADQTLQSFASNSSNSKDPTIIAIRLQLGLQ
jgi:hypothetical protein